MDVGAPPEGYKEWTTALVRFHGFANLSTIRGESVISPQFSCLGHQWKLCLYPGGIVSHSAGEGYAAVVLCNMTDASITTQLGYSIKDVDGKEVVHKKPLTTEFAACGSEDNNARCKINFAKRTKLMKSLVNRALVIEVRMKTLTSTSKSISQFIPTNPFNKNVSELFMDEETADVVFEVGGEQQRGKRKRAKTSSTNFHAHRLILQKCAPTLYEMCKSDENGGITTIAITGVTPKIFKHMLYYTYGGKLSDEELKVNAKDIINACDKYGVVHLKLEAEVYYIKSTEITLDNMIDNLLYADSKNLALLKEAVMDYIVANKDDIIGKVSFSDVPGDMMTDLLTAVSRGEQNESNNGDKVNYNIMRVGVLRKMLDEKGLNVDGSRESMIALLKEHDNNDDNDD